MEVCRRFMFWILAVGMAVVVPSGGCSAFRKQSQPTQKTAAGAVSPQQIQRSTMGFASRYIAAMADVYDDIARNSPSPDVQLAAVRGKLVGGSGALGCAVETNPLLGLMDVAVLVRLSRGIAERPMTAKAFGQENAERLAATMKQQEEDVWSIAAVYLTPVQVGELNKLCEEWLAEHPTQPYATNVELTQMAKQKKSGGVPGQLVSGVFGLITLDPFTGLDPAVREVEQSRVLAERLFFYLRHMPMLLTWQTDSLYLQLMDAPQSKQILANTDTVAKSTTQFSGATSRFSDSIENFRLQLPKQQATLVDQLNQTIATQRDAALKQATTQVSSQLTSLTTQMSSQLTTQQDAMTKNLQGVTDASIDRLYVRARSLVLITVGAILGAMILYRFIVRRPAAAAAPPKTSA